MGKTLSASRLPSQLAGSRRPLVRFGHETLRFGAASLLAVELRSIAEYLRRSTLTSILRLADGYEQVMMLTNILSANVFEKKDVAIFSLSDELISTTNPPRQFPSSITLARFFRIPAESIAVFP